MGRRRPSTLSKLAALTLGAVAAAGLHVPSAGGAAAAASDAVVPTAEEPAARQLAPKGLKVKVTRPTEAAALVKVKVKGPKGFRKTIKRTKAWSHAKPGVYRIKAVTITLFDQLVVPKVVKKKVRIKANRARKTSRVTYEMPYFCARSGARVAAWGESDHGRLGVAGVPDQLVPADVPKILGATAATGGRRTSYALCGDGTVWSWGYNAKGELGAGLAGDRSWPVKVSGLTGVVAIAAREEGALALRSDGTVWSWGSGAYGQLGNGQPFSSVTVASTPVQVALPGPATAIAGGGYTAYALLSSGTVVAWGNGGIGQLGNGVSLDSATPVAVQGLSGVTQIASGHAVGYALRNDDTVWAWGDGGQGQMGNGVMANRNTPAQVSLPVGTPVASIGASYAAGYVVTDAGSVWSWGSGRYGDLGFDSGGSPVSTPQANVTLSGVQVVVGAGYGAYALTTAGSVLAWGDHGAGQTGTGLPATGPGHTDGVKVPVAVPGLAGVRSIGAGMTNGYAVR